MTRTGIVLRVVGGALVVLWFAPTIALMVAGLAWRRVRFDLRLARVRRLRKAGRFGEAEAALQRLQQDLTP